MAFNIPALRVSTTNSVVGLTYKHFHLSATELHMLVLYFSENARIKRLGNGFI